jgi:hypothetical protein
MAVGDRLYGRWRSFVWPLEIVCIAVRRGWYGRLSLIVCMAVDDRLYGRWRSFVWPLEIVCMAVGDRLYGC